MSLHHALSGFAYALSLLVTKRFAWFGCFDGLCEISTLMLTLLFVAKDGLLGTNSVSKLMTSIFGLLLWLTYLVFRIALFPTWFYLFFADYATVRASGALKSNAQNPLEANFYISTNVVLLVLSSVWFYSITKGMLKALGIVKTKPKKGDAKKNQ